MTKIPTLPDEIFDEFSTDMKAAFGNGLISICLFGSGARGEYIPKKSDINFLVVVDDNSPSELVACRKYLSKWKKQNVALPLFLTREYIRSSLDTFPIEFLEMKTAYTMVFGDDLLKDIRFEKADLRRQAERELKGKLLHLRQEFLQSRGKVETLTELVASSLAAFAPVFRAILFIQGAEHKVKRSDLLQQICAEFDLDADLFQTLLKISRGMQKTAASEMDDLFDLYVEEMDKLAKRVDEMKI